MSQTPDVHGLHVLADDDPKWQRDPVAQARAACEGGARVVQLRAKHATDRVAIEWGQAIRQVTRAAGLTFMVNDRFDWALACEADGVHLGQEDLPPAALPISARKRLVVGRSTHGAE
ncbi:MAG: thiamine phosphate synthase, partial [Myxococcota bacterium]